MAAGTTSSGRSHRLDRRFSCPSASHIMRARGNALINSSLGCGRILLFASCFEPLPLPVIASGGSDVGQNEAKKEIKRRLSAGVDKVGFIEAQGFNPVLTLGIYPPKRRALKGAPDRIYLRRGSKVHCRTSPLRSPILFTMTLGTR
jgi:hypothetical protein